MTGYREPHPDEIGRKRLSSPKHEFLVFYRLLLWQENQKSPKRHDLNTRAEKSDDASCVVGLEGSIVNLVFVESAFETLQTVG